MTPQETDSILRRLGELADTEGIDSLNAHQQAVLIAFYCKGAIDNGGFRYLIGESFSEGHIQLTKVAGAFRALGFEAAANACLAVDAAVFGSVGAPPLPGANHRRVVDAADWAKLEAENEVIFDLTNEAVRTAISAYIDRNRTSFGVVFN